MSVRKNIILNGLAYAVQKLVRIADQLLLVPFFLSAWGASYYGEWLTLCTIPSVLAFSDLGIGTAVCNSFVIEETAGNRQKAANIFITGLLIITCSIVLGILISIGTMYTIDRFGYLSQSLINPKDATWTLVLMMAGRLFCFYFQAFEGLYRCRHRTETSVMCKNMEGFAHVAIGILILTHGYGIVAFAAINCIISILSNVIYAIIAIIIYKKIPHGRFCYKEAWFILTKGMGYFLSSLWQSIYFQGSTFIVRLTLGAPSVALFNTIRTAFRSINQIFKLVNDSICPELQIAISQNNKTLAHSIFKKALGFVVIISFIGAILLSTIGLPAYSLWTHNNFDVPISTWMIFVVGMIFSSMWSTSECVFKAYNIPYQFALFILPSAMIAVGSSYVLSGIYGLNGAAISYVLLDVLMVAFTLPYVYKKLGICLLKP